MQNRALRLTPIFVLATALTAAAPAIAAGPKTLTTAPKTVSGPTQANASASAPKAAPTVTTATVAKGSAQAPSSSAELTLDRKLRDIAPLSTAQKLAKAKGFGIIQGNEGVRGTIALSPRRPWLDARTVMQANFVDLLRPDRGPEGVMTIGRSAGRNAELILLFRAAAGSDYLVDCATPTAGAYDLYLAWDEGAHFSRASATASDGHVTFAVQENTATRDMIVYVSRNDAFSVGRCEITEVR